MAKRRNPRCRSPAGVLSALTLACLLVPATIQARQYRFEGTTAPSEVIGRNGRAIVLEAVGPPLVGRREIYRPVPPLELRSRWIMVQDTTLGVVFAEPSGVGAEPGWLEGDVTLRSLQKVRALELRALVFDVWGDLAGYLTVTVLDERADGERWSLRPRGPASFGSTV